MPGGAQNLAAWAMSRWLRPWLAIACAGWLVPGGYALQVRYEGAGCPLPKPVVQMVSVEFNRIISCHAALFKKPLPKDFTITYQIFRTREEFFEALGKTGLRDPHTVGFTKSQNQFQIGPDGKQIMRLAEARVLTWRQADTNDLAATLFHETAHAVTHAYLGKAPLWFMEGSAELLGTPAAGLFKMRRQEEAQRWITLFRLLENGQLPPLKGFLEADGYEAWSKLFGGRLDHAYTASYALMHFFMAHPSASNFLTGLMDSAAMAKSEDPNKAFVAYVEKHWPGGLAMFEKGWRQWIRQQAAKTLPANMSVPSRKAAR